MLARLATPLAELKDEDEEDEQEGGEAIE